MNDCVAPDFKLKIQKTAAGTYLLVRRYPGDRTEMYSRDHGWKPNRGELFTRATALYLYNSMKG